MALSLALLCKTDRCRAEFFQKPPSCPVGIEACASSHHWSRELPIAKFRDRGQAGCMFRVRTTVGSVGRSSSVPPSGYF